MQHACKRSAWRAGSSELCLVHGPAPAPHQRVICGAEAWTWGRGEYGRLGLGDRHGGSKLRPALVGGALQGARVVQAACGGSHTAVLTAHGRIFTWGRASLGRLGTGALVRDAVSPAEVALPGGAPAPAGPALLSMRRLCCCQDGFGWLHALRVPLSHVGSSSEWDAPGSLGQVLSQHCHHLV